MYRCNFDNNEIFTSFKCINNTKSFTQFVGNLRHDISHFVITFQVTFPVEMYPKLSCFARINIKRLWRIRDGGQGKSPERYLCWCKYVCRCQYSCINRKNNPAAGSTHANPTRPRLLARKKEWKTGLLCLLCALCTVAVWAKHILFKFSDPI